MRVGRALLAFLLAGSATGVQAQGLGAAAQKERDKRAAKGTETNAPTQGSAARVYTADDLVGPGGAGSEASAGSTGDPASLPYREKAARAAYAAAMEDWKEAGKARAALGNPPSGGSKGDRDRWDRNARDADRRCRDAEEAIAAARREIDAVEEEARRQQPPSTDSPTIRLPSKAAGEDGPGITREERTGHDRVAAARDRVTKALENLQAVEAAQGDVGAAHEELRKAEADLRKTLEIARRQGNPSR
jgi:hypothetical protein